MSTDNSSELSSLEYSTTETTTDYTDSEQQNIDLNGDILENYNIITELGSGAYSRVWLGYNIRNNQFNAPKVQNPEDYKDGISEIQVLKGLPKNENLLKLNEYFVRKIGSKKFLCSAYEYFNPPFN